MESIDDDAVEAIARDLAEDFHVHRCKEYEETGDCFYAREDHPEKNNHEFMGCICSCGAVTWHVDGVTKWKLPDGSFIPWPDPALKGE